MTRPKNPRPPRPRPRAVRARLEQEQGLVGPYLSLFVMGNLFRAGYRPGDIVEIRPVPAHPKRARKR